MCSADLRRHRCCRDICFLRLPCSADPGDNRHCSLLVSLGSRQGGLRGRWAKERLTPLLPQENHLHQQYRRQYQRRRDRRGSSRSYRPHPAWRALLLPPPPESPSQDPRLPSPNTRQPHHERPSRRDSSGDLQSPPGRLHRVLPRPTPNGRRSARVRAPKALSRGSQGGREYGRRCCVGDGGVEDELERRAIWQRRFGGGEQGRRRSDGSEGD